MECYTNKSLKPEFRLFSIYVDKTDFVWVYIIVGVMIRSLSSAVSGRFDRASLGLPSSTSLLYWGPPAEERGELPSDGSTGSRIKKVPCLSRISITIFA